MYSEINIKFFFILNKMDNNTEIIRKESFEIKETGEKILDTHDFFHDLSELMEDEKCSSFFNKYFTTMSETKITVVYMKLYQEFKAKWRELNNEELDKRVNIYLLWTMMKDRNINKFALHTVLDHLENPKNNDILGNLKEFIEISDKTLKLKDK